jgi:hypothetical protein
VRAIEVNFRRISDLKLATDPKTHEVTVNFKTAMTPEDVARIFNWEKEEVAIRGQFSAECKSDIQLNFIDSNTGEILRPAV